MKTSLLLGAVVLAFLTCGSAEATGCDPVPRLYAEGRYKQAREVCVAAICRNPDSYRPYYHLGNIELRLGRLTEAKIHYDWCLDKNPDARTAERCKQAIHFIDARLGLPKQRQVGQGDYEELRNRLFSAGVERGARSLLDSLSQREALISQASRQVQRVRTITKLRIEQMKKNSQRYSFDSLNQPIPIVDSEIERRVMEEGEEEATNIMEKAKIQAESITACDSDPVSEGLISQIIAADGYSKIRLSPCGTNQYVRNYFVLK